MSEITRFDFSFIHGVEEKPEGDFVYHWDYLDRTQELKQRITDLEQQLKTAKADGIKEAINLAQEASVSGEGFYEDFSNKLCEYANNFILELQEQDNE